MAAQVEMGFGEGQAAARRIASVTDSRLANLAVEELLVELLDRMVELLGVDTAAVLLLDPSSQQLVATAARGIEEEVRQGFHVPIGDGFAGRIAAERRPVIIERVDHRKVGHPLLREKGIRSLLGVPMVAEGTVIGVVHVGSLVRRRFSEEEANLLQLAADRAALATQTRLSDIDRAAAVALQRSLQPPRLPRLPGLDLAARYITGAGGVGGDWYDVFVLPSGSLCLVIGDVVGRGLRAAVVMGRLRSALRAYSLETEDPADILTRLDRKSQHFEPDMMATAICAIVEPSLRQLHMSVAGHPAPVIAVPGRPAVLADVKADLPIGVILGPERHTTTLDLRADCSRCAGLCCVAPSFSASADFAIDKAAGRACPHLRTDFRCD
ncbi:MAG TPA: GAF domain-containing SpoIIE family protein phosphatase, partial [Actinopolymorphaceae bacterium]|nr:GAF domain-containing SpoIIE family protein phosphatase [Actinopolymorphaceae bacterium]